MFSKVFGLLLITVSGFLIFSAHQKLSLPQGTAKPQVLASSSSIELNDKPVDLSQLHTGINSKRSLLGKASLQPNIKLIEIAQIRADDMASKQYFSHSSPDGSYYYDLLNQAEINRGYSCENMVVVFGNSAQKVLSDWLASEGHKECLLDGRHNSAGYAIASLGQVNKDGREQDAYIAVAIFAELGIQGN